MSVTIEDKIELFSKMIFGNIETQSSERKQKLIAGYQKELDKLTEEVQGKKKELIAAAVAKAERERIKLISHARNQQLHELVEKKQRFLQRIIERLSQLAADFTQTEDYKSYLSKNVETVFSSLRDSKRIVFYVSKRDIELCRQIVKDKQGEVEVDIIEAAKNIIGGLIAEDSENMLQLELTLKAIIDENKDTVGAAITRKFNEVSSL